MIIKIYSTNFCPYCKMAKDFLSEHNVKFIEINVEKDPEKAKEMISKSGQSGVPVIDIGGKIIIGFDREKIKKSLNLK